MFTAVSAGKGEHRSHFHWNRVFSQYIVTRTLTVGYRARLSTFAMDAKCIFHKSVETIFKHGQTEDCLLGRDL